MEACRACDGRGKRKRTDRDNVLASSEVDCSRCSGSGTEPHGPPKPRRFFRRKDEDENPEAEEFLRRKRTVRR